MAALSTAERIEVWAQMMREATATLDLTKAELRAAVDAVDDWADANAASFNTAIPQPARSALKAKQKAALLMYVVARRHLVT